MPTYPIICPKCDHTWEVIKSMSDPLPKSCPECRGRKIELNYSEMHVNSAVKGMDRNQVEDRVKTQLRDDMQRMKTDPEFARNIIGTEANPLLRDNRSGMEAGVKTTYDVDSAAIKVSNRKKKKTKKKKGTK